MADLVLLIHFAYVAFVVGGFLYIWIGFVFEWSSARHFWFRLVHAMSMTVVLLESVVGMVCPLTALEFLVRQERPIERSFMSRLVHRLMYYDWSEQVFTAIYVIFFLCILGSWFVVKPKRPSKATQESRKEGV